MNAVDYRVESRRVAVAPPQDEDLDWVLSELARPQTASALGYKDGIGAEIYTGYIQGTVLLLIIEDVARARVGFILLMRSTPKGRIWSVNIVVPEKSRRNAFTALAALDAMSHLVFDVRGDHGLVWLIEPDNGASRVLPLRLGYPKQDDVVRDGTTYSRYAIGPESWGARKARLTSSGRWPSYRVTPVSPLEVAHSRVIGAVRGHSGEHRGEDRATSSLGLWTVLGWLHSSCTKT